MPDPGRPREPSFHDPPAADEAELARQVKAGSERALECLLQRHWVGLVQYACRFVESQDQGEDIAQEAFVMLWARRETWRQSETLRPVIYRIARNLALNQKRRRAVFRRLEWKLRRSEKDPRPTPHRAMERAALKELVQEALDSLSDRRREVFDLVRTHRMTYREVGEVLGIAPQTVANLMTRAMTDLREALEPYLDTLDPEELPFPRNDRSDISSRTRHPRRVV
jgi:RNA polymerase sigma-70 factor, ECF subfamily